MTVYCLYGKPKRFGICTARKEVVHRDVVVENLLFSTGSDIMKAGASMVMGKEVWGVLLAY